MDFFDEINDLRKDFPKKKTITDEISNFSLNGYQVIAIGIGIASFVLGIFLGNLFATCQTNSYFFSESCAATEFNFSIMVFVWFVGFLISLFVFSIGHIIKLLGEINEKLGKLK